VEIRVLLRGAVSGFLAGILGFVFARIFAETYINKAIAYENGRDAAITAVDKAHGFNINLDGPEYFSRTVQQNWGLATGIIAFSTGMGALVAVAYLVLHGRFGIRPRTLALLVTGFGFLGIYLVPFAKYPANPPSIGHTFTIRTRAELYLTMVGCSLLFLALAVVLGRRLRGRFGAYYATLIAGAAFIVAISIVMGLLPPLGHLAANKNMNSAVGYGPSFTETPLPIVDNGHIVYPGFPADVLWKFRWYSILNQVIVWGTTGIIFAAFMERFFNLKPKPPRSEPIPATPEPAPISA
jgi:hypothetical protein